MFLWADGEGEVKPFWTPTLDKSHAFLPILLSDHFFSKLNLVLRIQHSFAYESLVTV